MTPLRAFGVVETPERPGPGPMPEPLLRALELSIGRRVDEPQVDLGRASVA